MEKRLETYFDRLWPLNRSLTGDGVRQSLDILRELIPLQIHEVPSGKPVLDWIVPPEWNVRNAYIITPDGQKIADFKNNNLHLVGYSVPVDKEISYEDLKNHVYTLPDQPKAVPYVTSYYNRTWGFCMAHETWRQLPERGKYRVYIESTLDEHGSMTYGDLKLPGKTDKEVFFTTYICHPGMANNELSGPLVTAMLYEQIAAMPDPYYTYRFVFAPETIGAINYLADKGEYLQGNMAAGFVINCVGLDNPFTYKRSRRGNTLVDKVAEHILNFEAPASTVTDFIPMGSDERQYCSPGYDLPVGVLMRIPPAAYPEYHTSLDNKNLISFPAMEQTVNTYHHIVQVLELNGIYRNTMPYGEPQLSRRGLYPTMSTKEERGEAFRDMLYLLSFADGTHDLIDIAEKRGRSVLAMKETFQKLKQHQLLQ